MERVAAKRIGVPPAARKSPQAKTNVPPAFERQYSQNAQKLRMLRRCGRPPAAIPSHRILGQGEQKSAKRDSPDTRGGEHRTMVAVVWR